MSNSEKLVEAIQEEIETYLRDSKDELIASYAEKFVEKNSEAIDEAFLDELEKEADGIDIADIVSNLFGDL